MVKLKHHVKGMQFSHWADLFTFFFWSEWWASKHLLSIYLWTAVHKQTTLLLVNWRCLYGTVLVMIDSGNISCIYKVSPREKRGSLLINIFSLQSSRAWSFINHFLFIREFWLLLSTLKWLLDIFHNIRRGFSFQKLLMTLSYKG